MSYFTQIIFPPKPKEELVRMDTDAESLGTLLDLRYWFEYTAEFKQFMVRCPTCGFVYCYSRLTNHASSHEIEAAIKENPKYFTAEWDGNCPKVKDHIDIMNLMGGLV